MFPETFELVEGITDLCRHASGLGYLLIVATNQAGIGRGYYSEADFLALTDWMCHKLRELGAPIAKVYYCPHHPEFGVGDYRRESTFRKPGPGMILQAADEFGIDLKGSVLVGDKESDIMAGAHPDRSSVPEVQRFVRYGSSPRGLQALVLAAKVAALRAGRWNVAFEDIRQVAPPSLRHRMILQFEALAEAVTPDALVGRILASVSPES